MHSQTQIYTRTNTRSTPYASTLTVSFLISAPQAVAAAGEAIRRFEAGGVPWRRPPDYFAEMVKSDEHMARVKEQLLYEKTQVEESEKR